MQLSMHSHFRDWARYNLWANEALYRACAKLSNRAYRRRCPTSGKSVHAVLNRVLVVDRLWLAWLRGYAPGVGSLEEELHEDFESLRDARVAEDVILFDYVHGLSEEDLLRPIAYRDLDGAHHANAQAEMLTHLFCHQVHERGGACTLIDREECVPPDLGLLRFMARAPG